MKKKFILTTIVSLFLAATMNAQTAKSNFAGEWELDTVKSTLPETMQVDSMKLKVSQTDKELSVESISKRAKAQVRGAMARGGGAQTLTYNLEGKDTIVDIGSGVMTGKETRKAVATADGKLNLTVTRKFDNEMGGVTIKTNEIWELIEAGKTLKVLRYMETPRGAVNAEMFFTRKSGVGITVQGDRDIPGGIEAKQANVAADVSGISINNSGQTPKKISGGVLNGKATSLPAPAYPAAARAVKASGTVNVQVTIDEQGNIISASAVSGHPLLRAAAEEAARSAKFAPTTLQGNPVSVTGVIVYNFVP